MRNLKQTALFCEKEKQPNLYLTKSELIENAYIFLSIATTIVEAGKDKKSPDDFAEALDSVLGDFAFPDVFLFDVWGAIVDVKNGQM